MNKITQLGDKRIRAEFTVREITYTVATLLLITALVCFAIFKTFLG